MIITNYKYYEKLRLIIDDSCKLINEIGKIKERVLSMHILIIKKKYNYINKNYEQYVLIYNDVECYKNIKYNFTALEYK